MIVLVTGASGFVGSHVAEQLARAGHHVRALVRATSNVDFLQTLPGLEFVTGAIDEPSTLADAVAGVDGIVHAAGLIKARSSHEFHRCNAGGTANLLAAARAHAPGLERFVLVSSVAATAPSPDGSPVANDVEPRPVTDYGRSKLAAERLARAQAAHLPVTILRPPMVYGPRDRETCQLFRAAARRVLPFLGDPEGKLSLVYGPDCARACALALTADVPSGSTYFVTDGRVYTRRDLLVGLERAVDRRALVSFPLPASFLRAAALVGETYGLFSGRAVMLTRQKLDELLAQWVCDGSDAERALGFRPEVDWFEGSRLAARWYREQGWLS
ncbi:MAG: NAD(P)-dependent oxidoreductase [Polyangiaceae bacterium]|jgi:nucleoside-diphosphate-sugar epimerase|nr:NAD(P)-dependent oxidoreductase [Polyangiaceae bacterium]